MKAIRKLLPLLKLYRWAIPVIIILWFLSSLSEGLGISLFIPLLQSFVQTNSQSVSGNFLGGFINRLFIQVQPNNRLLSISLCIFGSLILRNYLSYSDAILFAWLNSRISHWLRSDIFKQLLSVSYSFLESNAFR